MLKPLSLLAMFVIILLAAPWGTAATSPVMVRVALLADDFSDIYHNEVVVAASRGLVVRGASAERSWSLTPSKQVLFRNRDGVLEIEQEGHAFTLPLATLTIADPEGLPVEVRTRQRGGSHPFYPVYHGNLELRAIDDRHILLVNEIDLEEYLRLVVPSEMPPSWPLEALKAQAVASRTFAVKTIAEAESRGQPYHLEDSVLAQVYNNRPRHKNTDLAVEMTRGEIMLDAQGEIVRAYFHSTSPGYTASSADVWSDRFGNFPGEEISYLTSRPVQERAGEVPEFTEDSFAQFIAYPPPGCFDQESPWFRWRISLSRQELENTLRANLPGRIGAQPDFILTEDGGGEFRPATANVELGTIEGIFPLGRGRGGNLLGLLIQGSQNTVLVLKELNIRTLIRPHSRYTLGSPVAIARSDQVIYDFELLPSAFFAIETVRDSGGGLETVILRGGGSGHGVGMSQHGARGMALKGRTYREILQAFYQDISITKVNLLDGK